tara:strand:- start:2399 stop:2947 length:549 start_codon:yes stop_codon:yes gene_type:complete
MPCDITTGRSEACKESVGGLRAIYIANYVDGLYPDILANLDATETITDLTTPLVLFKFELRGENNTMEETNENSRDNGTSFWTQTVNITLKKQDAVTQLAFKELSYGRPHILTEDYNGKFRLIGAQNGAEAAVSTSTGGAMGDLNGYNITIEGKEISPALFVDPAIVGAGLKFDISTLVYNP